MIRQLRRFRIPLAFLGILAALAFVAVVNAALSPSPQSAPSYQANPLKDKWTATSRLYQGAAPNKFVLDASVGAFNYKAPWKGVSAWTEIDPQWEVAPSPW